MGGQDTRKYNAMVEEYREVQREFSDYKANFYGVLEQFKYKMTLFSEVENGIKDLTESVDNYFIEAHAL